MKTILLSSAIALLLLSGCASNSGPEYDGNSYKQIKTVQKGVVTGRSDVVISDTGKGRSTGSIVGSVAGSAAGYNSNNWLVSIGGAVLGGLAGGAVGAEVGKSDGSELTVDLDSGQTIVIVVKQNDIQVRDRIEIVKSAGKVERVNKIE